MKNVLNLLIISFVIGLTACSSSSSDSVEKTEDELKMELLDIEQSDPVRYLYAEDVTMQKQEKKVKDETLFREAVYEDDGAIIEGTIFNKATLAKYKDLRVKVTFYSKTESVISEDEFVIYEFYEPNSSSVLNFKIDEIPSAYHSFTFDIVGATPSL
jgi:hypothetical protein